MLRRERRRSSSASDDGRGSPKRDAQAAQKKGGVALALDPSPDVPSRCGTQQGGPAWEAMHAPSLDG